MPVRLLVQIPFPLNVLLLPASIAEWALMYFISK
jgi:hypothetical protein